MQSTILFPDKFLPCDAFSLKELSLEQGRLYIPQNEITY